MNKIFLILLIVFLVACKNEENKSGASKKEEAPKEVAKPELILNMEFKTNKQDLIVFLLNKIKVDEFQYKSIQISEKVMPTTILDKITANFGSGNFSRKLVIDLGRSEVKEFEIVSLSFQYGDNYLDIHPDDIEKYFGFSKFTVFDKTSKKIITKKVDNAHYPRLYARSVLWDQLVK